MAPSSSVRVEVKCTFCDFIVIDTRDKVSIISPLRCLYFKVGVFNFRFGLSGYAISFKDGIYLGDFLCMFSICCQCHAACMATTQLRRIQDVV